MTVFTLGQSALLGEEKEQEDGLGKQAGGSSLPELRGERRGAR